MSQTRQLETLQARRRAGKFPVVRVGDEDYEFVAAFFGGTSPMVNLASPDGEVKSRSVADWKRLGADFVARSRSLPHSYVAPAHPPKKTDAELAKEVRAHLSEQGMTGEQRTVLARIRREAEARDVRVEVVPPRHGGGPFRIKLSRGMTSGDAVNVGPGGELRHAEMSASYDPSIVQLLAAIGAQ